jgi:predicted AlkP superfamily phosphohydrolase/phosphomutase
MARADHFILLGLDGAVPGIIEDYVARGKLPAFRRLMAAGAWARHLPFPSAVTPVNWASVSTGAHPGTHGISDFLVHVPGNPYTDFNLPFTADWVRAELLWESFSRQGRRVATISYPQGRPRRGELHAAIGDDGVPGENSATQLAPARLLVSAGLDPCGPHGWREYERVVLRAPGTWTGLDPAATPVAEATLPLRAANRGGTATDDLLVLVIRQGAAHRMIVGRSRDVRLRLADVEVAGWTPWIEAAGAVCDGTPAVFRLRPVVLGDDRLQLYLSPLLPLDAPSDPPGVGATLSARLGPYGDTLGVSRLLTGWLDDAGMLDEFREQARWQADAALALTREHGYAGVFTKWHAFDKFYHFFFDRIDPVSPHHEPAVAERWEAVHGAILGIADDMVARVMDGMDDRTVLLAVSDHGLQPTAKFAWVNNYLARRGFIATSTGPDGKETIDWSRTRAIMHPFVTVWINLRGRDPQGCVAPGDFERTRDEVIAALREWRDGDAFVLPEVLRTGDAAFYGLWGERDGDIRIFSAPGYSLYRSNTLTPDRCLVTGANGPYRGDHGSTHPSASFGRGSEFGVFSAVGAGIRAGVRRAAPVLPCDIVPTLCTLLDAGEPSNAEGAVLRDLIT